MRYYTDPLTICFFGQQHIDDFFTLNKKLNDFLFDMFEGSSDKRFLISGNGEFIRLVAQSVSHTKHIAKYRHDELIQLIPHPNSKHKNYFDKIEIFENTSQIDCYKQMIDRSDIVVCYVDCKSGSAYKALQYAKKQNKHIKNLAQR